MDSPFPKNQRLSDDFPRFGLGKFANRFPANIERRSIEIKGAVEKPGPCADPFEGLERSEMISDFHCVTTWSVRAQKWSGVYFADLHKRLVQEYGVSPDAKFVKINGEDEFHGCLPIEDMLADNVMLADRLNDAPLGIDHGAPMRLVAPAHYGYKSVKHISSIEYLADRRGMKFPFPYPAFMEHPRARIAHEERARYLPNWLIVPIYRMLIKSARARFRRATKAHLAKGRN